MSERFGDQGSIGRFNVNVWALHGFIVYYRHSRFRQTIFGLLGYRKVTECQSCSQNPEQVTLTYVNRAFPWHRLRYALKREHSFMLGKPAVGNGSSSFGRATPGILRIN